MTEQTDDVKKFVTIKNVTSETLKAKKEAYINENWWQKIKYYLFFGCALSDNEIPLNDANKEFKDVSKIDIVWSLWKVVLWVIIVLGIAFAFYWFYLKPKWSSQSENADQNSDLDEGESEGVDAQEGSQTSEGESHSEDK